VPRQRIPFCNNANAAIRRSVWEDGLRYDEVLTGLEDLDWAKRAIDDGFLISYVAEAPVIHVHDEISSQIVNRYRREAIAHRQIYNEQRMRLRQAVRFATVNIVQDWTAARKEGALRENLVDIPRFRSAQFYGTFRGFMQTGPVTESLKQRFYFPDDAEPDPTGDSNEVGQAIDYDEPVDTTELS
jgi:hypothetical protein